MKLILANTGSYPRVGDSQEQQILRRTIALWEKGEKTLAELRAVEESVTKAAIDEQVRAGLDLVTDGQIRWYDPISHIAGKLEGVKINGLLRFFDTNFYFRQPVVEGKLQRRNPLLLDEFRFASSVSSKPVKVVLTGPYTLAKFSITGNSGSQDFEELLEQYTAIIRAEIKSLGEVGAQTIQVDEPAILKYPEDFHLFSAVMKDLSLAKGQTLLALYTYFGDASSLYTRLQELPVDIIGIDFTYSERLLELVLSERSTKPLGIGLVDGRNTRLETKEVLGAVLEKLVPSIKADYSYLNPSCGLEYLPRDRAFSKLKNMVEIGRRFSPTS